MTVQTHDSTTEDTISTTTTPEPAGATAAKEAKAKKPVKLKIHKSETVVETVETVETTPAAEEQTTTTTTETQEEEQPERKIPKLGKGGPMAWLKRMAMLYGDHPRSMARSPNILSAAGVDPALLTEELLKEATKVCLPAAQAWAKRVNEEGKETVAIVETTWFNYGVVEVARQRIVIPSTESNGVATVENEKSKKPTDSAAIKTSSTTAMEIQAQILSFMKKGKTYTSRDVVLGLNRKPGGKEGGPVVNVLKRLEKEGVVAYAQNEEYSGYCWSRLK